ncbi:unnamed protein product, partial [Musa acuminata subsp. burmannicoides]
DTPIISRRTRNRLKKKRFLELEATSNATCNLSLGLTLLYFTFINLFSF